MGVRCVTTSLYSGLFCPTSSSGAAFVRHCLPVLLGSDQITGHEALYPGKCGFPLHRIGDVRGLGVTASAAIPATALFGPLLLLASPRSTVSFLGLTHGPAGPSFRFDPVRFRPRMTFPGERIVKEDGKVGCCATFSLSLTLGLSHFSSEDFPNAPTFAENFERARLVREFRPD